MVVRELALAARERRGAMTPTAHEDAVQRLETGLLEQDRCSERYDAAIGTTSEVSAYTRLRAAGARVAADETRLHRVDDES
jgi:hypothetical protein